MEKNIVLLSRPRIIRTIKRFAIQIWEKYSGSKTLVLVGLGERGYSIALELSEELKKIFPSSEILLLRHNVGTQTINEKASSLNQRKIFIIDDVIFSGKTMFEAIKELTSSQNPESIEVVNLVDRGHRKYPILANYTGIKVPTKMAEHIEMMLSDGKPNEVILFKNK